MFGLSWGQIGIIVLIGLFVLGPERIPTAVSWLMSMLRKLRSMAAGAQAELRREIGPELDELRRQVADLQSLKELQELRELRDLHPKRIIGKNVLGDEFSGGMKGFLGLSGGLGEPAAEGAGSTFANGASTSSAAGGADGASGTTPGSPAAEVPVVTATTARAPVPARVGSSDVSGVVGTPRSASPFRAGVSGGPGSPAGNGGALAAHGAQSSTEPAPFDADGT